MEDSICLSVPTNALKVNRQNVDNMSAYDTKSLDSESPAMA